MKPLNRWRLAMHMLAREWRAGEQRILVASLVIAVAASTAIGFFTDRLGRGMVNQSADFLGADLVLASPRPVDPAWLRQAKQSGLRISESLEFASMVVSGETLQLASIKAVDAAFPLRGSLRTTDTPFTPDAATQGVPSRGEVWVAARLLSKLDIGIGARVDVGAQAFTVSRILTFEPGEAGDIFGVSPRVLMNLADIPATRVIQPGSRLSYRYLFAGDERQIHRYRNWLQGRLGPSHELVAVREGRRAVGSALERAEQFLGLSVLAAIVLAGVAIAMAAARYSERHFDMSAMLRCLGASQRDLFAIYLPQLVVIGLISSVIGCLLGWIAQHGLLYLLADLLPVAPSGTRLWPVLGGFSTALIILLGFALPPLMRLKAVPPLRVLRRDLLPLPTNIWVVYGTAITAVVLLMWRYTGSWTLSLSVLAGGVAGCAMLGVLGFSLLAMSHRLKSRTGAAWRFGLNNLWRQTRTSVSQILAFGLALMAMAVIALVRTDLLTTWQRQLPSNAPNHFAVNILPDEVTAINAFFRDHRIETSQLYPMVRGRLISINAQAVREAVSKEASSDNALNRELNLTWTTRLQEDNAIVSGRWWQSGDRGLPLVSVELKLAQRLGIHLGDELGFAVGDRSFAATVVSIRSVQWDSFRPNFYMIFPPGVLDSFAATYMTSFYLAGADKSLLTELLTRFPAVTVLELDQIMAQVGRIFRQVTLAVEYVLIFVLLAGFAVMFAALQTSLDERLYAGALLRALGASRQQLRAGHVAEFAILGLLAGLVAAIGTECLAWLLYTQLMHLDYSFKWPVWLATPLIGATLVGIAGYWGTRPVVKLSPLILLREE